jgi:hypothetical protein
MHWLFFGKAFSSTLLQLRLLQHRFNIASTTSVQHHLCNIVFCSSTPTSLLQHHLLQHRFNTAFATSSFVASLLLLSGDKV